MANAIVAATSSLSGGVLTLTFKVADSAEPIENFDLVISVDPAVATLQGAPIGATANWTILANPDPTAPGSLLVGGFSGNFVPVAPGGDLLTLSFLLADSAATSLALAYSGTYNADNLPVALTGLVLGNGSVAQNEPVMGRPMVTGTLTEGSLLTADTSGISDGDGLGAFSYQWLRDGVEISGETGATYQTGDADAGKKISVRIAYDDGAGNQEVVSSLQTAAIANVNDSPMGAVTISGTAEEGQMLTATHTLADADGLGSVAYQWLADGQAIVGATADTLVLGQAQVGKVVTVRASYKDGFGTDEQMLSAPTAPVANVNDAPAGAVSIGGTAQQGQTLTATHTLADEDGLGTVTYQWYADDIAISGATSDSLVLGQAEVGKTITVTASYIDGQDFAESVTSAPSTAVTNVNDLPTGAVTITGEARQGQTLTASNTLADLDGMGALPVSYQWFAGGEAIAGATGGTLVLEQAQVGKAITVVASYTDGAGQPESMGSTATPAVVNVNDAVSGTVTVSGTHTQGETLTASATLADIDGLGTIEYQWLADGADIAGATGASLTLGQEHVGKLITVRAGFVDGQGTAESMASADPAGPVANLNDPTTGTVAIVGAPTQGQTLSISNTLADLDGIPGGFTYQWLANDADIAGATNATFTLTGSQLNATISVRVGYVDGFGNAHSVTSAATDPVILNNLPVGTVTITGTATEGETLTASSSLTDADNDGGTVASVTYHWLVEGVEIGATGPTLVLGQAQVGKKITVEARYTDQLGVDESVSSDPTAAVANVNQPVAGDVTISGTVAQGQVLTAVTSGLADTDGLGTFNYQWFAGGVEIAGATGPTFTPTQTEVNQALTVRVSYTDGQGTAEEATSAQTAPVANANDAPSGTVTIAGTFTQGQTLTASHALADADGLGIVSWQWMAGGQAIAGATGQTFVLTQDQVGQTLSVRASYTDGFGQAESMDSAPSAAVANLNDLPTGAVTVTGSHVQGQVLTASHDLQDADGLGTVTYQWLSNGVDIAGATGASFTLTQAQVGTQVTVRASYTDQLGAPESATSTAPGPVANTNDAPTGTVTVAGSHVQGQTLTASNDLADADGMGTVSYQWLSNGTAIAGATGATYTLTQAEVGKQVTVRASYTDLLGQPESASSVAAGPVGNSNDAPTGTVTISGTPKQGNVLTAVTSALADADGLGAFSYQWLADGAVITGATGSTFTPGQGQVDSVISVRVTYTDGYGTSESVTSDPTAAVANTNDAPTGTVSISGTAAQGQTLTASNTLADADGMGAAPVGYQWLADGQAIAGATGATFVLTQAQVGKAITVQASYTDGFGQPESRSSAATARVANVNDAVVGTPVINGLPTQGATLTAVTTGLSDADGLGAFSYQWLADGVAIAGATGTTLALTQAQVDKAITVRVSYTDGYGSAEAAISAPTVAVANVDDDPTGAVLIEGARVVGMPLTANTSGLADLDGLGAFNYQWYADGAAIGGATAATYMPVDADGGKAITVTVGYTDGFGAPESVTSVAVNLMKEDDAPALVIDGVAGLAGDGNGDGLVDSVQDQVISAPFTASATNQDVFVTLVADSSAGTVNTGSTTQFQNVRQEAPPAEKPASLDMPLGLIDFTAVVASVGKTESFSLFVDASLGANGYWKKDASGVWHNLASEPYGGSTTVVGNKIRLDFQITDGGRFDNDGKADGVITDPGAIGSMPLSVVGYAPDMVLTPATHFFF